MTKKHTVKNIHILFVELDTTADNDGRIIVSKN